MLYNQLKNYEINDLLKLYNEYTKTNYLFRYLIILFSVYFILKLTSTLIL